MLFIKFFIKKIFFSRQRQHLLILSAFGLIISSMALLVLQGVMTGLQEGLIKRSKSYLGEATLESYEELKFKERHRRETLIEVLLEKNEIVPSILHGLDDFTFDQKDFSGLVLGTELARQLKIHYDDEIQVLVPHLKNFILPNLPRFFSTHVSDVVYTQVAQLDFAHSWISSKILEENFIEGPYLYRFFEKPLEIPKNGLYLTWEEQQSELVWALALEKNVMIILFGSMSLIIALSISFSFAVFFYRIKKDLVTFHVLGLSFKKLYQKLAEFGFFFTTFMVVFGLFLGKFFLEYLKEDPESLEYSLIRKFPIKIEEKALYLSFFIPFMISMTFFYLVYFTFKKEKKNLLNLLKRTN